MSPVRRSIRARRATCILVVSAAAIAPLAAQTTANATPKKKAAAVSINGFSFSPSQITVRPGARVTWTNTHVINGNAVPHDVTKTAGPRKHFASGDLIATGKNTFTLKLSKPGTYAYKCDRHDSMTGTIVVK